MGDLRILGVFKARGVLSEDAQRMVRLHCNRGNAAEMVEAVAEALLSDAMARGRVPQNAGVKTKDLLDRAENALFIEASDYHIRGGYLTAKGFVSIQGLVAEMAKRWLQNFSAPIPTETVFKGTLSDPEIQTRLTVVALKLRDLLLEAAEPSSTNSMLSSEYHTLIIKADDVEGICRRASVAMFQALQDPNAANHEILHKEKP